MMNDNTEKETKQPSPWVPSISLYRTSPMVIFLPSRCFSPSFEMSWKTVPFLKLPLCESETSPSHLLTPLEEWKTLKSMNIIIIPERCTLLTMNIMHLKTLWSRLSIKLSHYCFGSKHCLEQEVRTYISKAPKAHPRASSKREISSFSARMQKPPTDIVQLAFWGLEKRWHPASNISIWRAFWSYE